MSRPGDHCGCWRQRKRRCVEDESIIFSDGGVSATRHVHGDLCGLGGWDANDVSRVAVRLYHLLVHYSSPCTYHGCCDRSEDARHAAPFGPTLDVNWREHCVRDEAPVALVAESIEGDALRRLATRLPLVDECGDDAVFVLLFWSMEFNREHWDRPSLSVRDVEWYLRRWMPTRAPTALVRRAEGEHSPWCSGRGSLVTSLPWILVELLSRMRRSVTQDVYLAGDHVRFRRFLLLAFDVFSTKRTMPTPMAQQLLHATMCARTSTASRFLMFLSETGNPLVTRDQWSLIGQFCWTVDRLNAMRTGGATAGVLGEWSDGEAGCTVQQLSSLLQSTSFWPVLFDDFFVWLSSK